MTPAETITILRQFNEWRRGDEDIPQFDPREIGEVIDAAVEMIDRLEAAEKSDAESIAMSRKARDERDALRAKVAEMEKQEPVAWARELGMDLPSPGCVTDLKYRPSDIPESAYMPLYALPGAQPAPSVPEGFALVNAAHFLAVLDREDWRTAKNRAELRAMLAAAPEANP